uniref:ATP-dependent Clp protease proteolytic subunit n=1 Tax=Lathyrus pubescens TaxID=313107 RepID=A0A0F6NFN0_9FABA|nr:clp protease proteolytic subunit [Lathyrus pubescens]AIK21216.1 clp protease proteolytic subunit [Lathyrus pubescens]
MPVGVPKVSYVVPGEDEATWIELYQQLFYERKIFLCQVINRELGNQVAGMMIHLNLDNKKKDFHLFINSPGGSLLFGMAIFDIVQTVQADVNTICIGLAASMANLILAGGTNTKRVAFPHAKTLLYYTLRMMLHEPGSSYFDGKTDYCLMETDELLHYQHAMIRSYSEITHKPEWQVNEDMFRDSFMSPEEAQAYGIIDGLSYSLTW